MHPQRKSKGPQLFGGGKQTLPLRINSEVHRSAAQAGLRRHETLQIDSIGYEWLHRGVYRAIEHAVSLVRAARRGYRQLARLGMDFPGPRTCGSHVLRPIADAHNATPRASIPRAPAFTLHDPQSLQPRARLGKGPGWGPAANRSRARLIDDVFPLGRDHRELPVLQFIGP